MKQFVFLIDNGSETKEHKITATGMTDAVNRIKDIKKHLNQENQSNFKISFKGVIYENA